MSYLDFLEKQLRQPRADKAAVRRQIQRYRRNPEFLEDLWKEGARRCYAQGVFRPTDEMVHSTVLMIWLEKMTPAQRVEAIRGARTSM